MSFQVPRTAETGHLHLQKPRHGVVVEPCRHSEAAGAPDLASAPWPAGGFTSSS